MKITKTRIIVLVVVVIASALVVLQLKGNKKEFQNEIAYTKRKVEKIPVAVEKVNKSILSKNVLATGTLEASDVLTVVSETQGKIIKIYKEAGDNVSTGDVIVKVDDEVIAANVMTAEANYAQYEKDVERFTRLAKENAIAVRDLEQAQIGLKKAKADLTTAQKALKNTSITAPISGYINSDNVTLGQFLGGGSPVCEIVNNRKLKLNIQISEYEVYRIEKGQNATIRLSVFPGEEFRGRVTSIAEKANDAMKFNVEITLNNEGISHLRSGLYAEAELPAKNTEHIIIEKQSIIGSMENPEVFVAQNGKALRRTLVIGQSNDKQVEVLNGLSEGDEIVISGQLNLKDGDDIIIIK